MTARGKRRVAIVIGVVLFLGLLRMTIVRAFDETEWKRLGTLASRDDRASRQYMYLDLKLFGRLNGLSREDVMQRLGDPAPNPGRQDYQLFYDMGRAWDSLDTAYLAISFEEDRVRSTAFIKSVR